MAPLRFKIQIGVHGGAPPKGVCRRSLPTTFVALTPPPSDPPKLSSPPQLYTSPDRGGGDRYAPPTTGRAWPGLATTTSRSC